MVTEDAAEIAVCRKQCKAKEWALDAREPESEGVSTGRFDLRVLRNQRQQIFCAEVYYAVVVTCDLQFG